MRIRVPDYYERFQCLAGACPHTCCTGWEIVLDEETVARYRQVTGALGEKLRTSLCYDDDGDPCFAPEGGRCPFLDKEGLCEIHRALGPEATSETCRQHPRFTEDYGPFREVTLSASCPAANDLLLSSEEPLTFPERETAEESEAGDEWLSWLVPLRNRMLAILEDRRMPLRQRLGLLLELGTAVQDALEEEREADLANLAETWQGTAEPVGDGVLPAAWALLGTLEVMEPDWPALRQAAETAEAPAVSENLLERIGAYFLFRYLLKAVNDGDVLSRVKFGILMVLLTERLAAVCGLPEALRRLSCEVEHSDENLEGILEAFWGQEAFSVEGFR